GKNILIFPEMPGFFKNEALNEFDSGFIRLARWFFLRNKETVAFYPIAVNKKKSVIEIGRPVQFQPNTPFSQEKTRIKKELEDTITEMYFSNKNESGNLKRWYEKEKSAYPDRKPPEEGK
ncbi:MAG: hypothetical protein AB1798_17025, partial [Spirochaetota bacterium]